MSLTEYTGQERPTSGSGEHNRDEFAIWRQLEKLATSIPVKVIAVRGTGVAPVGFVDVQPMVQQVAGDGSLIDHGIIPNLPYFRLQGGANAVVIDPTVGDIGIACFSSRDISAVKNARTIAPPGSARLYDLSDGMYVGGILNAAPTTYIQFTPAGITIHAALVTIEGDLTVTGVTKTNTTLNLNTHVHTDPQGGNTGGPINV